MEGVEVKHPIKVRIASYAFLLIHQYIYSVLMFVVRIHNSNIDS